MFRRWHLLLITLLLAIVVLNKVHAYYDDDDEDDDDDYDDDHYDEDYEDDDCDEDQEDHKDLEYLSRVLKSKGINAMAISGQNLVLPNSSCTDTSLTNPNLKRFNAIFFGDFYSFGGQEVEGPLAVKGNFVSSKYAVNTKAGQDCSAHSTVDAYGLVVGGGSDISSVDVHGDALVQAVGDIKQLNEVESGCSVTSGKGTGAFDFATTETEANNLSKLYLEHPPTLQLDDDDSLIRLTDADNGIEYLTFNSCEQRSDCSNIWEGKMSLPQRILLGEGATAWGGIQGDTTIDGNKIYVFNIPVTENTLINISTSNPSLGFNPCKLIYNFYPVKSGSGTYNSASDFSIARNTAESLYGLTLAPKGKIIDGEVGNFAGQVIGKSYIWSLVNGVSIYGYKHAGGTCDYFGGCDIVEVPPPSCNTTETTVTETATVTQDTIATVTQQTTVTGGTETVTQLSTVTNSGDVTKTTTLFATETFYHTHDEDCDEEEEEYYEDSYKKKWDHKEHEQHEEEDDCDEDHED